MLRKRVAHQLRGVQGAAVVDVYGHGCDLEQGVLEAHEVMIGPDPQAAVLGQAVAADARAGEDQVVVGGPGLRMALITFTRSTPLRLGEGGPLVHEGQQGGPEAVLHDLGGLALDGPVQHGERELRPR